MGAFILKPHAAGILYAPLLYTPSPRRVLSGVGGWGCRKVGPIIRPRSLKPRVVQLGGRICHGYFDDHLLSTIGFLGLWEEDFYALLAPRLRTLQYRVYIRIGTAYVSKSVFHDPLYDV